jgi:hypothetical protein
VLRVPEDRTSKKERGTYGDEISDWRVIAELSVGAEIQPSLGEAHCVKLYSQLFVVDPKAKLELAHSARQLRYTSKLLTSILDLLFHFPKLHRQLLPVTDYKALAHEARFPLCVQTTPPGDLNGIHKDPRVLRFYILDEARYPL